ncbi:acetyl-CoA carboxylase biotin carboxyl carrier protein subunit [Larkinella terrae]|uniref:Acetyl-CoA carboxylase biotin carboxyl carrier protein subunit n=1 Tax=Larkinella terrae TaxID=2025311 RepID=A0A7K0EJE5_9BACT|nr:acetyl-CoA carboxylase biotin carboxyl carrier protein subunit [Larkinella terrae]MRS61586.1 acetyl-CoA carboxylase biotin carboxyl carrier protein subunit [Larkinella terrae]
MFRASVNDQESFEISFSGDQPVLNGQPLQWDLARLNDRTFHILHQNRSYTAEILQLDPAEKTATLKINQSVHRIKLKDRFDLLLEKMGMSAASQTKINHIKAPMPGLILSLNIQPGDTLRKGDTVLILEAMKMENVIKSPTDGIIKTVLINRGQTVDKNQVLVEFN